MTTRGRREPTNITLTISVDLHQHYEERRVQENILPPIAFDVLARKLAATVAQTIADVDCITIGEPARRNFAVTFTPHGRPPARLTGRTA